MKTPPVFRAVARLCMIPGILFSLYLLWVGHHQPGGGFIAGLVALAILVLQRMAANRRTKTTIPEGLFLMATGLGLAVATGLGSFLFDSPFLTSAVTFTGWSTAFFFDLGVYALVLGGGLLIMTQMAEDRHD